MICAAFDCSCGAALAVRRGQDVILNERRPLAGRTSDRELTPWVLGCLAGVGVELWEVERWVVGTGPGSFTGIRVGIAFVQGVCGSSEAACWGVPSSLALAAEAAGRRQEGSIGVLHDARRGQLILSEYALSGGMPRPVGEPAVWDADDVLQRCSEIDALITVHGQATGAVLPDLAERIIVRDSIDAALLLAETICPWPSGDVDLAATWEPIYVRPAVFVEPRSFRRVYGTKMATGQSPSREP